MVYSEQFYVGYSDVNTQLRLSNSALLRYFEDIASMHGTSVGDGPLDSPYRWILLVYHVCVHSRPIYGERVTVKSWNRAVKGVTSCREFELYDEKGDLAVTAISNWVRVDSETGKLQRLGEAIGEQYGSEARGNFDSAWIPKAKEPAAYEYEKQYFIDRNFIDANHHMNNVYYLDLADCVLPQAAYDRGCDTFSIYYRKAVLYGETVTCCYAADESGDTVAVKGAEGDVRAIIWLGK